MLIVNLLKLVGCVEKNERKIIFFQFFIGLAFFCNNAFISVIFISTGNL